MADGATAARTIGYSQVTTSPREGSVSRMRPAGSPAPGNPAQRNPAQRNPAQGNPAQRNPAQGNALSNGETAVADIDEMRFRSILGRFATGVVAITAIDPETGLPTGLAANSFTSVSLDPPLVAFCVAHTSSTWPRLRTAERHCVNILSEPQREVCLQLAAKGSDKFADLGWTTSPSGGPVIDGALAWLECSVEAEHTAGDHDIVVARVHHLDKHHDGQPLVFYKGDYGSFDG